MTFCSYRHLISLLKHVHSTTASIRNPALNDKREENSCVLFLHFLKAKQNTRTIMVLKKTVSRIRQKLSTFVAALRSHDYAKTRLASSIH
jgi:hypothetical protein